MKQIAYVIIHMIGGLPDGTSHAYVGKDAEKRAREKFGEMVKEHGSSVSEATLDVCFKEGSFDVGDDEEIMLICPELYKA